MMGFTSAEVNLKLFALTPAQRTYAVVACIPKGTVLTYKTVAQYAHISNPRHVGSYLHKNPYPGLIPCHRVVTSYGDTAKTFAFGGLDEQVKRLVDENVRIERGKVDLINHLWQPSKIMKLYWDLLFQFGYPGKWPWFGQGKPHTCDEIMMGAVLTQNTNWKNVEKALKNLKGAHVRTLKDIYVLGKKDSVLVKELIKPSGFYNQKTERLIRLAAFMFETYSSPAHFFQKPLQICRQELLSLSGIGKETADTILLYVAHKPVFVIDAYTKRFVTSSLSASQLDYDSLQKQFTRGLPESVELFQDYHALIVQWGKQ